MKRALTALLVALFTISALTACGSASQTIRVFAAASLKKPFTELAASFEAAHPGVEVQLNFGGSPTLVQQVNQGASADVLATASTATMAQAPSAIDPRTFATNMMEIAVPLSNPAKIASLRDLTKPGVTLAVCQAVVPCGAVAEQVFSHAHLTVKPATELTDVKSVLALVDSDNVDAGLVYVTDVRGDGQVRGVTIPASVNAVTTYPIAVLRGSDRQSLAQQFVDYVTGSVGETLLASQGWGKP